MNRFTIGSNYFFSGITGFKSKDSDTLILVDTPKGFNMIRQTSTGHSCLFELRRCDKDELIDWTLKNAIPMAVGKFLIPEFNKELGITLDDLKRLEPLIESLDEKHLYEKDIYQYYLLNGDFILSDSQRSKVYETYMKYRVDDLDKIEGSTQIE